MYTIYGIPNCDTTKLAFKWMDKQKIAYTFHDYKKSGITGKKLEGWIADAGLGAILNKKSTTWRGLDADAQASAESIAGAVKLMQEHTSLIKRPIIEKDGKLAAVGFNEASYTTIFSK